MNNVTVPLDRNFYERMMSNEINKAVRRCKIGKVTPKIKPFTPYHPFPFTSPTKISDDHWYKKFREVADRVGSLPDMCAGCKGACGNVACPKRMVVTC